MQNLFLKNILKESFMEFINEIIITNNKLYKVLYLIYPDMKSKTQSN